MYIVHRLAEDPGKAKKNGKTKAKHRSKSHKPAKGVYMRGCLFVWNGRYASRLILIYYYYGLHCGMGESL